MSTLSTQPYKGARDFYPDDMRLQNYIFSVWRKIAESYGYEEYMAPVLEPSELYYAKTGQEIVNEQTYSFKDRGDREVTVRPEMTPSVSRMVAARRQELGYPLRLFSIPNLWRYERPQKGRLREHWQLNVDLFGLEGLDAEVEMISMARDIMKKFGARSDMYQIRLNSRQLIDAIMKDYLFLDTVQSELMMKIFDKFHKMPEAQFHEAIAEVFEETNARDGLKLVAELFNAKTLDALPAKLRERPELLPLKELLARLDALSIRNIVFDVTLMRGFDYYNDVIFEVFDTDPNNNRSMFGGGRYDGLVGLFGVEPVPTIGFGMGDVVIGEFLKAHDLLPKLRTNTDLCIITIGDTNKAAAALARTLRAEGVKVAVDYSDRKMDKKVQGAHKKGIPYVLFLGDKEVEESRYNLKHLATGQEERHSPERIIAKILDSRHHPKE